MVDEVISLVMTRNSPRVETALSINSPLLHDDLRDGYAETPPENRCRGQGLDTQALFVVEVDLVPVLASRYDAIVVLEVRRW